MKYQTTIKINNTIKNITLKPALYMDTPLWEITLDDMNYIVRKTSTGWEQSSEDELDDTVLNEIGLAINSIELKEAG